MVNKKWPKVWPIKKWQNNWRIRQDGPGALLWSIVNQLVSLKLKTEKSAMLNCKTKPLLHLYQKKNVL